MPRQSRLASGALSILTVTGFCLLLAAAGAAAQDLQKIDSSVAIAQQAIGHDARVWVFFSDKGLRSDLERATAMEALVPEFSPRTIARRMLRGSPQQQAGIVFSDTDLPVAPAYLDALRAAGATVHITSRWLNAASVSAPREVLESITTLPFVTQLKAVARSAHVDPVTGPDAFEEAFPLGEPASLNYGRSTAQLTQINLIKLHDTGFTGAGVVVGILDTGFHRAHKAFNNPLKPLKVIAEWDFVKNDPNTGIEQGDPSSQHSHGTMILGTLAAYDPNQLIGGAFDASFVLAKTEDTAGEYRQEEDFYAAGLEFIEARGADMSTSSLGYIDWYTQSQLDGKTAVTTKAVNIATQNGLHCCTAAGNEGHDTNPSTSHLIAPADAFQVITCGAATSTGGIASFSSDGPTADGRVKPEVLALGSGTATVSPSSTTGYTTASGTSLSTPLVAGAVACLVQANPTWTPDQMRDRLFKSSAYYVTNRKHDPQYVLGYGMLNAYAANQDCNGNGVPDILDLALGTSRDCNGNGVPEECELAYGDCNCDGFVNFADINPFVVALTGEAAYLAQYPNCKWRNADANRDCVVDFADINPFVELLREW